VKIFLTVPHETTIYSRELAYSVHSTGLKYLKTVNNNNDNDDDDDNDDDNNNNNNNDNNNKCSKNKNVKKQKRDINKKTFVNVK